MVKPAQVLSMSHSRYSHNVYIWKLVSMETTIRINASSTFVLLISFAVWFLKSCWYLTGWQWEQKGCSFSDCTKSFILKVIFKLKWAGNNDLCLSSQSHSTFLSFRIQMHSNEITSALGDICISRFFLLSTGMWNLKCIIFFTNPPPGAQKSTIQQTGWIEEAGNEALEGPGVATMATSKLPVYDWIIYKAESLQILSVSVYLQLWLKSWSRRCHFKAIS